jgi:hypothetical protein
MIKALIWKWYMEKTNLLITTMIKTKACRRATIEPDIRADTLHKVNGKPMTRKGTSMMMAAWVRHEVRKNIHPVKFIKDVIWLSII